MAYNNRMSQQFHGSQQHGRGRKKEDENDALMRLPDKEIAGCINDIGIPFTAADLIKPNPQQVQMVLEWFAELLMNTTRDTVEPAMRAAADDVCGDFPDIVPTDTRNLMGFFANLRRLMLECGVNDFTFTDLTKPTHDRLIKIFSYLINFVRFRESQTAVIDEHFNKTEKTKQRIDTLYGENQDMEQRLEEMRRSLKANESEVKEKMRRNDELKVRLRQLGIGQEQVAETLERVKAEKGRQQTKLKEKMERTVKTRQEVDKLQPYVMESPASLQSTLTELSDNLLREKAQIDAMEKRARALQTSSDTFTVVSNDVQACVKLLEDVSVELHKEDDEELRALRNREAISERGNNVREVEQTEGLLQRQLSRWNERIEALRNNARGKAEVAQQRMEELREVQKELREERGEKQRDMERRRIRIEQTEKKMADLKENIESEVQSAHDEYLKLESHIKLYVTEMEKSL
ncbi:kinetochore-associated Ndc80 complex subunit NUF2 [Aspergillus puulaauensis]|uniref:Probable kinetochore protein NUF2 n=1 Tax=Aspergillus puulaauensis TaxID=1220207 RepID=A0A7R8AGZ4_9EURO|nr:kinetochore-associated Ndc80 complex subunit nuf2 [Aspergillus puulaauensis]BCS19149.1 kinetochore-associated Ndc80 complex subunit nuf2 [Aspergillus puulaauensis]